MPCCPPCIRSVWISYRWISESVSGLLPAYLFAEDAVCERLGLAIVRHVAPTLPVTSRISQGFGRIRTDVPKYRQLARRAPVVVITDLDDRDCPMSLMKEWDAFPRPGEWLSFRVAVRECESWVLADATGVGKHFGFSSSAVSATPDELPNPKQALLSLLRRKSRGRADIVADMLPASGSRSPVGLGYNLRLRRFVDDNWSVERAIQRSPSLSRAVRAVTETVRQWGGTDSER